MIKGDRGSIPFLGGQDMSIFILANGGEKIGMGHIMRTSVLAYELQKVFGITYVVGDDKEFEEGAIKIKELGFHFIYEKDIMEHLTNDDILIIDRYDLNEETYSYYRKVVKLLIVFDDNNLLDFYDVDMILNQNLHAKTLAYKNNKHTKLLLGSKYVLLRDEFLKFKKVTLKSKLENILVTVGGSDNFNITSRILREIKASDIKINVVIGIAFNNRKTLKEEFKNYKDISFYENANMPELMRESDLVISACGGTIYELAYLGVPTIGLVIVDNQEQSGNYLEENNIVKISKIENLLKDLNKITFEDRKKYSEMMKSLVDGKGKYRIVESILSML